MTLIGSTITDPGGGSLAFYQAAGIAATSQTITVTYSSPSGGKAGISISYTNVGSIGTPTTVSTTSPSNTLTQSASCATNQVIVQAFEDVASNSVASTSGGTSRGIVNSGGAGTGALALSDGTGSITFTATAAGSVAYAGIAVVLS